MQPKALIISGYGLNSEMETAFAFKQAGIKSADIIHINDLISKDKKLDDYQILAFPGGFSYGDHTGGGLGFANKIKNNLWEELLKFIKKDTLTIGICNGFQILTQLGILPALSENYGEIQASLLNNDSNRFTCRYVNIKNISNSNKCIWTKNINQLSMPIAHGEGNFTINPDHLKKLKENDQIIFKYTDELGNPANNKYPTNPNGTTEDIAGIRDPTGKILGLMPHPERALFTTNHPNFTLKREQTERAKEKLPKFTENLKMFENAVNYFA